MSKIIKLTQEYIDECKKEFEILLSKSKFVDGKISFQKNIEPVERKATVFFTQEAWLKMKALIDGFDSEVGWHGIARRGENDEYYIDDILVYPQEVTGATVTTDQEEYQEWLMSHDDDTFNNIRMQGHSHVNMGVTPSSVDDSLYDRILQQIDDSMFYIFMIWNKRGDKTIKIYDMKKNIMFDTKDVEVRCLDNTIEEFIKDAKRVVKQKVYSYASYYTNTDTKPQYTQPSGFKKEEETAKQSGYGKFRKGKRR